MHNKADFDKVKNKVRRIVEKNKSGVNNLVSIYKAFSADESNLFYALKEYWKIIKNMYI
jgi:hypothetical protein